MVTVEADPVHVESRLAAWTIGCPACGDDGVLGGWGYDRARRIVGLGDRLRPRRARCRACAVTHVLLPAVVLLRRAYAAELIWSAFTLRAEGCGHRRVAAAVRVPATTVRGWLRRIEGRLEVVRSWFLGVAVLAGVDVTIPDTTGCRWRDLQCAVETASAAVRSRFESPRVCRRLSNL
ncbi:helix-turn-helix domain-containing protein [Rhodococcus sp. USK10]|uniref:helix-turn-helix domain-containing protein n=1 Tax=Rhodococcus sp. USK10 TaxID=2789739 RepID=UPI0021519CC6|nr:helix-turn-helix domain-containing protein [Rhodococcus sp. USK10]